MLRHNAITKNEYDSLTQIPIRLNYSVENNYDGQALYFRQAVANYLREWCEENGYDLYSDGLKIYTTIDTRLQKYAEEAAIKQMEQLQEKFDEHWRGQEPWRDEHGHVMPNFIEDLAKKSIYYRILDDKYNGQKDSIKFYMNEPHKLKVFTYNGMKDTMMSTMDSIRYTERFLHCGFVVMEPQTSQVKAWVGDLDFSAWKYDKVTAGRQPGSTFKLFVYTEAMNQGLTPFTRRTDSYFSVPIERIKGKKEYWTPHNANGYCTGANMTLRRAFAQSVNTIAAKLGTEIGIENVIKTAHDLGIKSQLDTVPSLSLGSSDVNLLELVNSYCTIVDDGKYLAPVLVTKILDRNGKIIFRAEEEPIQVVPYRSAWMMQQLLLAGMREYGGTSQALWRFNIHNYNTNFGGKTGTSSNHSDAWYIGTTRNLVGGAWVGGEYRCIHFRTGELGQGSRTALPIFGYFMEKVLKDPDFKQYQGMFPKDPLEDIGEIIEEPYYEPADTDTIQAIPDTIQSFPIREEIISIDTIY